LNGAKRFERFERLERLAAYFILYSFAFILISTWCLSPRASCLLPIRVACCLAPHACLLRAASFFLEIAFSVQKATSELLNNAFYATLRCHIKKLPLARTRRK
jgi:hypothetical protein